MPELVPVHRRLTELAGGGDRAARFLSTWCPPRYLGGCSIAALAADGEVRLVRNYDLSPDLNEGLLLRSEWTGPPVMGMVEFLWGLSDGVNAAGLAAALAYGGRSEVAARFRRDDDPALRARDLRHRAGGRGGAAPRPLPHALQRHACGPARRDRDGRAAGRGRRTGRSTGGRNQPPAWRRVRRPAASPAPQSGATASGSCWRRAYSLDALAGAFLREPLFQRNYDAGFGTLFTAIYDPVAGGLTLRWPDQAWHQTLAGVRPRPRMIRYRQRRRRAACGSPRSRRAAGIDPPPSVDRRIRPARSLGGALARRSHRLDTVRAGPGFRVAADPGGGWSQPAP